MRSALGSAQSAASARSPRKRLLPLAKRMGRYRPDGFLSARRYSTAQPPVLEALIKCGAFDSTGTDSRRGDGAGRGRAKTGGAPGRSRQRQPDRPVWSGRRRCVPRRAIPSFNGISRNCCATRKRRWAFTSLPIRWTSTPPRSAAFGGDHAGSGQRARWQPGSVAGIVQSVKLKNNKAGKRYATFSLEDLVGAVE